VAHFPRYYPRLSCGGRGDRTEWMAATPRCCLRTAMACNLRHFSNGRCSCHPCGNGALDVWRDATTVAGHHAEDRDAPVDRCIVMQQRGGPRAAASGRAAPPPRATSSTRSSSSSTARAPRPEPHTRGPLRRSATPSKRPCHRLLSTPPTSPQACTRGHSPSSSFSCRLREGRTARMLFVGAPAAGRRAVAGARRTGVRLGRAVHGAAGAAPGAGGGSGRPGGRSSGHQGGDASGLPRAVPRARCSASRRRRAPGGQQP